MAAHSNAVTLSHTGSLSRALSMRQASAQTLQTANKQENSKVSEAQCCAPQQSLHAEQGLGPADI